MIDEGCFGVSFCYDKSPRCKSCIDRNECGIIVRRYLASFKKKEPETTEEDDSLILHIERGLKAKSFSGYKESMKLVHEQLIRTGKTNYREIDAKLRKKHSPEKAKEMVLRCAEEIKSFMNLNKEG